MRLIDADAMNEKLFYKQLGGKDTLITVECAFNMIKAQPTAYNIENVVAELEERRSEYKIHSQNAPDAISTVYRKGVMRGYEYSQDIVRKGGVCGDE